jgi:mRNA interferase YafQ
MREVVPTFKFKRDMNKVRHSVKRQVLLEFDGLVDKLANDIPLPERLRDHQLSGDLKDLRECHFRSDLLLLYRKEPGILRLIRLASHSELFR